VAREEIVRKEVLGIARITYIIDENGRLRRFTKVKPAGHSEEVIAAIKSLR
jgi:peroxiredoxin